VNKKKSFLELNQLGLGWAGREGGEEKVEGKGSGMEWGGGEGN
jgi:hypothetical protein